MALAPVAKRHTTAKSRDLVVYVGSRDVTDDVQWKSLVVTDAGTNAKGTANLHLTRALSELPEIYDQAQLRVVDTTSTGGEAFRGYIRSRRPRREPAHTYVELTADDIGSLLDDIFIPTDVRPAETMQARIGSLWGSHAGPHLSGDLSNVASIGGTLPAQNFSGVTLRQAIEMTISQASSSADYYVDMLGKLHVFTSETNDAPFGVMNTKSTGSRITIAASSGAPGGDYHAFPGVARLADDRLITVYGRGTDDLNIATLNARYSSDEAATWGAEQEIWDSGTSSGAGDSQVTVLTSGRVIATAGAIKTFHSTDDGATWSAPNTVAKFFTDALNQVCSAPLVELPSGTLLMPIYGKNTGDTYRSAALLQSTDSGLTWANQITIASNPTVREFTEPVIVRFPTDGMLVCLLRSETDEEQIWRCESTDSGATWSTPVAVFTGSGRPAHFLTDGGALLSVYRQANPPGTGDTEFRTSADRGETWTALTTLASDGTNMFYAALVRLSDGRPLAVYTITVSASKADLVAQRFIADIGPHDLEVDYDSNAYANRVYVQGASPTGSGVFKDDQAIADANGLVRTAVIQAPDSQTAAMAQALANMYLGRVKSAKPRGSFSATSPDNGWRAGQNVLVGGADLDLPDQTYRIARVTTRIVKPGSDLKRRFTIEFGGARAGGSGVSSSTLGSGQLVSGNLGGQSNTYVTEDGVSVTDGTNVRVQAGRLTGSGIDPETGDPSGTFGLRVISSDGTTVIIDGTSDMFRISATGTLSVATVNGDRQVFTKVTLTGLGALSSTPVHLTQVGSSNATTGDRWIGIMDDPLVESSVFVATTSGGSPNLEVIKAGPLHWRASARVGLNVSNEAEVHLRSSNQSGANRTAYARYYILEQTAI